MRVETIGNATLYLGDCREILPTLGKVDAVVTDPPYGVGYAYVSYDDAPEQHETRCADWVNSLKSVTNGPIALSCAIKNMWQWPQPHWVLSWRKTFSVSRSPFGSGNWEPVLIYNKGRKADRCSDSFEATFVHDELAALHPCPKPVTWAKEIIRTVSLMHENILDPFMGSGTTGVAALRLGREFIGIEIEPKYFDIACRRIDEATRQKDLFIEQPDSIASTIPELLL